MVTKRNRAAALASAISHAAQSETAGQIGGG
jgi:hypothetical protein